MSVLEAIALILGASVLAVFAFFIYRYREPAVRGRAVLAVLRAGALLVLLALVIDPALALPGQQRGPAVRVLVDASLSMKLPDRAAPDGDRWSAAVQVATRRAGDRDVYLFGAEPRATAAHELGQIRPTDPMSRLSPAIRAAAEAGARRAVVVTDGGIEDLADAGRWAERLGIAVEFEQVGAHAAPNRSLVEVQAPSWAEAGSELEIRVAVAATGVDETIRITVNEGETQRAQAEVAAPQDGALAVATLRFPAIAPPGGGRIRYDIALEPRDALPDDDVRPVYVHVSERPAGVTLVSFRPDWEPRFLAPALERSLGLPLRAYLRVADGRYVQLGAGAEAGRPVGEAEVRRALEGGEVVVLHGPGDAPAWAIEAGRRARRLLLFADDRTPQGLVPVPVGSAQAGDWYIAEPIPASPMAGALAGSPLGALPPLPGLRPVGEAAQGGTAVLHATRGRRGDPMPVVTAGETAGRRWVLALGEGYWTWALRGGETRAAYRHLWSGVGGWLVRDAATLAGEPIRPAERVAPRGTRLAWVAPGLQADSLALVIVDDAGVSHELGAAIARGDTAFTAPLPPGHYRYRAAAFTDETQIATAEGPFSVESWSPEFVRAGQPLTDIAPEAVAQRTPRRPFRTSPIPYALLLGLLGAEWILRRRWGLR